MNRIHQTAGFVPTDPGVGASLTRVRQLEESAKKDSEESAFFGPGAYEGKARGPAM
jgi:hypothetical protein